MDIGAAHHPYCVAAAHVEGQAALQLRQSGSTGGTIHHNNPHGTCLYCLHALPRLLPPGVTLAIVPPDNAQAPNPWWIAQPVTFAGQPPQPTAAVPGSGNLAVYSLAGGALVTSPEELRTQLDLRVGSVNHFTLSSAPAGHPLLTLTVNRQDWVAHYFDSPNDPGSIALGSNTTRQLVEIPDPSGALVRLAGGVALDPVTAFELAARFLLDRSRSTTVAWRSVADPGAA